MAENSNKAADDSQGKNAKAKKGAPVLAPGATEVRTSDPNIEMRASGPPPKRAVAFQTSGISPPPTDYPSPGAGGVVQCDDKNDRRGGANGKHGQDKHGEEKHGQDKHEKHQKREKRDHESDQEHDRGEDEHHHHGDHKRHEHAKGAKKKLKHVGRKMPRWPTLLITCVLALVCGVGGAWGYSALFGESQSDHQGKGGKSDKAGKLGGEKSGGSDSDQNANEDHLKKQVDELADGIDQLGTRIDRLNQAMQEARQPVPQFYPGTSRIERMAPAGDDAPPVPHALQTQLTVLQRKVENMADLPVRVQELERRLTELQEAIKLLAEARTSE